MPDTSIIIIEAPGKVAKVSELAASCLNGEHLILATKGRLFDLPRDSIGISVKDGQIVTEQQPINPEMVRSLSVAASKCARAFIMTDNDTEGDVIADQCVGILSKDSTLDIKRIRLNSFDSVSFKKAFDQAESYSPKRGIPGHARRIADRIIGYTGANYLNDSTWIGSVGRVLSPLLKAIDSHGSKTKIGRISRVVSTDSGKDVVITAELTREHSPHIQAIASDIANAEEVVTVDSAEPVRLLAAPWNFGDALLNISRATHCSVEKVSESLQRLYEQGRISYPRSASRCLLARQVNDIALCAAREGYSDFEKSTLKSNSLYEDEVNDEAHTAICPIGNNFIADPDAAHSTLDQACLNLISLNLINSGKCARMLEYRLGFPPRWEVLKKRYGLNLKVHDSKQPNINRSWLILDPLNENHHNIRAGITSIDHRSVFVLRVLIENELGRPSTLPYFSNKVSSRMLNEHFQLNGLGLSCLAKAYQAIPLLLNNQCRLNAENALMGRTNESVSERVLNALSELQLNSIEVLPLYKRGQVTDQTAQMNKDHPTQQLLL